MAVPNFMFDTETMGLKERAIVTTLSCVPFTFEGDLKYTKLVEDGFFVKFKISEQVKLGRETTPSTVAWWKGQPNEAKAHSIIPSADDVTLEVGLNKLVAFLKANNYDWKKSYVWSRGNGFDFPKIEDLFDMAGIKVPFNTFRQRDVRTYVDVLTGADNGNYDLQAGVPREFVKHHALHDAALDAAKMIEIYKLNSGE